MLLAALAVLLVWRGADKFWHVYPDLYVWTEDLLSYGGGFVRRGLVGQLAFWSTGWIAPRHFMVYFAAILYLVVALRVIVLVLRRPSFPAILFLVSPLGLIFPLLDFHAYGRKDIVILAGFLLSLALIRWLKRWPMLGLLLTMLIFVFTGLTHETAWSYFPLVVAFLVHTAARDRSPKLISSIDIASTIYMLAALALIASFPGNPETSNAMVASWQVVHPEMFVVRGAADWLGYGIGGALKGVVDHVGSWHVFVGYGLAALLGLAPVLAYGRDVAPKRRTDMLGKISWTIAALSLLTPFVVASDWGRYSYMACVTLFAVLASMDHREHGASERPAVARLPIALLLALTITYSSGWRVLHWVQRDIPIRPGYLFDVLQPVKR